MQGRYSEIGKVHGNLCHPVFFYEPSNGLAMPQRAGLYRFYAIDHDFSAFFPDIKRDGVCPAYRGGIEIEIHGNQEIPRSDHCQSCGCRTFVIVNRTKIGFPPGVFQFGFQPFVFTRTADGKIPAIFGKSCMFITINGDVQFFSHPACQLPCIFHSFLHGHT